MDGHFKLQPLSLAEINNMELLDDGKSFTVLETLIFPDTERSYNELDQKTTEKVLRALEKETQHPAGPVMFECENCIGRFAYVDFEKHVCLFNENQQLIKVEPAEPESELRASHRRWQAVLEKNQAMIRDLVLSDNNKDKPVDCPICCRKFVKEDGLYRHWDRHIGEILEPSPEEDPESKKAIPMCTLCSEIFLSTADAWDHVLNFHITVVDGRSKLKHVFKSDEIQNSKKQKTEEVTGVSTETSAPAVRENVKIDRKSLIRFQLLSKIFNCELCDRVFGDVKAMLHHESKHSASSGFHCNCCDLKGLSLKQILLHRRDECLNGSYNICRVWVCNSCDDEFLGLEQLFLHRFQEHHYFPLIDHKTNELQFSCHQCVPEVFPTAPLLIAHFQEKHVKKSKGDVLPETSERVVKPEDCSSHRGGSHQTSTRPRMYLCEVCGKSYTQSSHLWQHLRFHQGVKPFACTVEGCGRKFTIRPDLNDHVRKCHTGERPYLCKECGKRFLTGSVYYQHRLIHLGERRYECEECKKRFYRADALKNHMRIHTGEKPHCCSICGKKFRQRGDRDKHIKARHPGTVFVPSPKRERIKSFGKGRVKNNTSLYRSMPESE